MTIYQSGWATRQRNTANSGCAGAVIAQMFEFELTSTALQVGDIIEIGVLPAHNSVSNAILISDELDTNAAPTIAFDVGVMSGEVGDDESARTCGAELFAASSIGQAGGVAKTTLATAFTIAAADKDRSIGVEITAAALTQAAAGAKLRLLLEYRAV